MTRYMSSLQSQYDTNTILLHWLIAVLTVILFLPGRIATGRISFLDEVKAKREGRSVEDVAAESTASIPAGRYGRPEEYADVTAFLTSTRAAYITGSVIRVDGGLIASV